MRKSVVWASALCLTVAVALVGCGSQGGSSSANGQQVIHLTVAWWGTKERADKTIQAIKLFEKKNPNIQVTTQYSSWGGYWDKLATQVAAGTAPDVIQMDSSKINSFAARGALLTLDDKSIDTSKIDKNALETGKTNGKLYGIVSGIAACAIFYDPAVLKEAGVEIGDKQLTWQQYADIARQIHQKLPGVYGTLDYSGWEPMFQFFLREHGQTEYTADGKLGFTKQTLIDWLNYWGELRKEGVAPPADYSASQTASTPLGQTALATGKSPYYADFAGDPNFYALGDIRHEELGLTMYPALPGGKQGNYVRPAMYWSIYSKSQHPDAAAKLINFLVNDVEAGKILGDIRSIPVNSDVRAAAYPLLSKSEKDVWEFINKTLKVATPPDPSGPAEAPQVSQLFTNITQKVESGQLTPQQAADEFFAQAQSILGSNG